jgi:hypothetical protein
MCKYVSLPDEYNYIKTICVDSCIYINLNYNGYPETEIISISESTDQ